MQFFNKVDCIATGIIAETVPVDHILQDSQALSAIGLSGCVNDTVLHEEVKNTAALHPQDKSSCLNFDVGIDEVGRGPLYGSVVIAATILPKAWSDEVVNDPLAHTPLTGLTDSKKISEKKRNLLTPKIKALSVGYVIVNIPANVIDRLNIYQATLLGMRLASESLVSAMLACLNNKAVSLAPQFRLLIDGNAQPIFDWNNPLCTHMSNDNKLNYNNSNYNNSNYNNSNYNKSNNRIIDKNNLSVETWVKGDSRHTAIAAASVLAKVDRDTQLIRAGKEYPNYGFEKHKGYPTKAHITALTQYGVLPCHRRSFKPIQKVIADNTVESYCCASSVK